MMPRMSRTLAASLSLVVAASLAACGGDDEHVGDDDPTPIDAAVTPDAEVPDAEVPDAMFCAPQPAGLVGGPCDSNDDCNQGGTAGFCLVGALGVVVYPPEGFCILDDFAGTACDSDDDCGAGAQCTDQEGYRRCLPTCSCAGNTCPANQACSDSLLGVPLDRPSCIPGDATAQDGDACDGAYECFPDTACRNNPLEFPGGQCYTSNCTVGTTEGCNGGTCIQMVDFPFGGADGDPTCVETCTDDGDCRTAEGYVCFDPGAGGTRYCRHPQVGDPCATTDDCGPSAVWECKTGAAFPGGYCSAVAACATPGSLAGCSPNSMCFDDAAAANYCVDRCPTIGAQSTCRAGYTCVDTDPGAPTTGGCVPD